MVLFYFADRETLILSGAMRNANREWVVEQLNLDLRLLVLLLAIDDCVLIVPAYFLESPICREVVLRNIPLIEAGYLRLLRREPSNAAHRAKKEAAYVKVRHIEDYRQAYYADTDHGLVLCRR